MKLSQTEATVRKWLYAGYVYVILLAIIFFGVRTYIGHFALRDEDPLGWAVGYAFGNLPWVRFRLVYANLERWACLPLG